MAANPQAHTCESCHSLLLILDEGLEDRNESWIEYIHQESRVKFSASDAIRAAERGCSLCSWILYPSLVTWSDETEEDIDSYKLYFKYKWNTNPPRAEIIEFGFKKENENEAPACWKRSCRFIVYEKSGMDL